MGGETQRHQYIGGRIGCGSNCPFLFPLLLCFVLMPILPFKIKITPPPNPEFIASSTSTLTFPPFLFSDFVREERKIDESASVDRDREIIFLVYVDLKKGSFALVLPNFICYPILVLYSLKLNWLVNVIYVRTMHEHDGRMISALFMLGVTRFFAYRFLLNLRYYLLKLIRYNINM